jgi:hypothetical protein
MTVPSPGWTNTMCARADLPLAGWGGDQPSLPITGGDHTCSATAVSPPIAREDLHHGCADVPHVTRRAHPVNRSARSGGNAVVSAS